MTTQEQIEFPEMYRHYLIGVASGVTHHAALIYSQAQIREEISIEHLIIKR